MNNLLGFYCVLWFRVEFTNYVTTNTRTLVVKRVSSVGEHEIYLEEQVLRYGDAFQGAPLNYKK